MYAGELQVLGHLGWGDERASPLAAHDAALDSEVVERLSHRRPGDVELLAERTLGGDGCPWGQTVDVLAQPLPQLVVLRLGGRRRSSFTERLAVAHDFDLDPVVTVGEGERLPPGRAVGLPAELVVEPAGAVIVDDDPERGERAAVGAKLLERGVQQPPPDAGAGDVGLDVNRIDVTRRTRVVVSVRARAEVDETDDPVVRSGGQRAAPVGRLGDAPGPHLVLMVEGRRRDRRVGGGPRAGMDLADLPASAGVAALTDTVFGSMGPAAATIRIDRQAYRGLDQRSRPPLARGGGRCHAVPQTSIGVRRRLRRCAGARRLLV